MSSCPCKGVGTNGAGHGHTRPHRTRCGIGLQTRSGEPSCEAGCGARKDVTSPDDHARGRARMSSDSLIADRVAERVAPPADEQELRFFAARCPVARRRRPLPRQWDSIGYPRRTSAFTLRARWRFTWLLARQKSWPSVSPLVACHSRSKLGRRCLRRAGGRMPRLFQISLAVRSVPPGGCCAPVWWWSPWAAGSPVGFVSESSSDNRGEQAPTSITDANLLHTPIIAMLALLAVAIVLAGVAPAVPAVCLGSAGPAFRARVVQSRHVGVDPD